MRSAQISVFIVLGLVLVLTIGIFLYISSLTVTEPLTQETKLRITDQASLKAYVETCIQDVAREPLILLGKQGGSINPQRYRWYSGSKVGYLCSTEGELPCVNTLVLRTDLEKELSLAIEQKLDECLAFDYLKKQGYDVETGEIEVTSTIADQKIYLHVFYPIELSLEGTDLLVQEFDVQMEEPLGFLYRIAEEILNQENAQGYFDQIAFMKNHTDILITKYKPYPSTMYILQTKGYRFQFVIEGVDTTSHPGEQRFGAAQDQYGCCYIAYDKSCYANTPQEMCDVKGGYYESWPCGCDAAAIPQQTTCTEGACASCEATYNSETQEYNNPEREHGESWCVYEGPVGKGYDYVGTRHYLHYCFNGTEYVEEGRDFREELCTEEKHADETTSGVLRPNRWQDCSQCTTEDCCMNEELRDCYWHEWLSTENKCTPQVPPGFRFWEWSGQEVCMLANEEKECSGLSCQNKWIDDAAFLCNAQGDCGNARNVNDELTTYGYVNSDMRDTVRSYVYLDDGMTKKRNAYVLALDPSARLQEPLSKQPFETSIDQSITQMTVLYTFIDSISYLSLTDMVNPFVKKPDLKVLDVAFCNAWQAPPGSEDCSVCMNDPLHPCSEYRCKSLGQACVYEEQNGIPSCMQAPKDATPVTIQFDKTVLTAGYSAEKKTVQIADTTLAGYEITPHLIPHKVFTMGITTNKETICELNYAPSIEYLYLPAFSFGERRYAIAHNLTMRVPPKFVIPEKFKAALNVSGMSELLVLLTEKPKGIVSTYEERFKTFFVAYRITTGTDLTQSLDPMADTLLTSIAALEGKLPYYQELARTLGAKFDSGGYFLFVECTDRQGNKNQESLFIELSIDTSGNDTQAPVIVAQNPLNHARVAQNKDHMPIILYVDEPATCRFDTKDDTYENMKRELTCPSSAYALSPVAGGSYPCKATIPTDANSTTLYVRCIDHPVKTEHYELQILKTQNESVMGLNASRYANVSNHTIAVASSLTKKPNDVIFAVNTTNVTVMWYVETLQSCTLYHANSSVNITLCNPTNQLELGFYQCTIPLTLEAINNSAELWSFDLGTKLNHTFSTFETNATIVFNLTDISAASQHNETVFLNLTKPQNLTFIFKSKEQCSMQDQERNGIPLQCKGSECKTESEVNANLTHFNLSCFNEEATGLDIKKTEQGILYNYSIVCSDAINQTQNVNTESYVYTLTKSEHFAITHAVPTQNQETTKNPVLTVTTTLSENVRCSYGTDEDLGMLSMRKLADNIFQARLSDLSEGFHTYQVKCYDTYQNEDETDLTFYVKG